MSEASVSGEIFLINGGGETYREVKVPSNCHEEIGGTWGSLVIDTTNTTFFIQGKGNVWIVDENGKAVRTLRPKSGQIMQVVNSADGIRYHEIGKLRIA